MVDIMSGKTIRITQTQEQEFAPRFILKDEWVVYNRNQNLYAWHTQNGSTLQLTNISRGTETAVTAVPFGGRGAAQLGGARNMILWVIIPIHASCSVRSAAPPLTGQQKHF